MQPLLLPDLYCRRLLWPLSLLLIGLRCRSRYRNLEWMVEKKKVVEKIRGSGG